MICLTFSSSDSNNDKSAFLVAAFSVTTTFFFFFFFAASSFVFASFFCWSFFETLMANERDEAATVEGRIEQGETMAEWECDIRGDGRVRWMRALRVATRDVWRSIVMSGDRWMKGWDWGELNGWVEARNCLPRWMRNWNSSNGMSAVCLDPCNGVRMTGWYCSAFLFPLTFSLFTLRFVDWAKSIVQSKAKGKRKESEEGKVDSHSDDSTRDTKEHAEGQCQTSWNTKYINNFVSHVFIDCSISHCEYLSIGDFLRRIR